MVIFLFDKVRYVKNSPGRRPLFFQASNLSKAISGLDEQYEAVRVAVGVRKPCRRSSIWR